ncbi:MAG: S-methyl-5-thioribose-1-phosphate isomerase [Ignavibacteria bacterium]|nr:S-methyl-5-thioribose-1-phosphate isomerase [Ignavibacteria bacterium]MBT8382124.1 S-methyl-5-thioribose-1-phosphate isomerase [Ignavibacteria bacterium]MBT8392588.1 S-methyl-5-thioribose-1-phosphate isomerase [Ignavibacteria bacterium]NNJ53812.1 S-methyl-5-thioribose-1-phosphate isomerase [Ignavibacteriaceae bacterium]NNL21346.1 S-methyl-5-thioribose-1-phosphate isomerase [Ignavibacteriaceae bacterium]
MTNGDYFSVKFKDDKLVYLDQTKLPLVEEYVETDDYERIALAIERLEVRGAPLIGICAAYAIALSVKNDSQNIESDFNKACERIQSTRPTAVNLFWAIEEMKNTFQVNKNSENIYKTLLDRAIKIHNQDEGYCRKIGYHGLSIFKIKSNVLTHCNTGKLATGGDGTAFSVIKTAFENGLVNHVYADETRPLLQGSRLTAFELDKCGIPFSIQTDSSAAELLKQGKVDLVITGADRVALNGDSANKIGTYMLAVLANYHNIPFYIAAPSTTVAKQTPSGKEIEIEYRNKNEVLFINQNQITHQNYDASTPAFDVTPAHLITGIITEEGVYTFPYNFLVVD